MLNRVMLIGNLGGDPELRYTANQLPVANFSLATNEVWTDKDGNKTEKTEWHRVVVWRKLAEICSKYLKKGQKVYIEGTLRTRTWDDNNGVKRYITEIQADKMLMLGNSNGGNNGNNEIPPPSEPIGYDEDVEDLPF